MQTITIEKDNAIKAYKEADDKGKTLLTNLLGKKHFLLKITDRIKSFEDACEELGLNPNDPMFTQGTPDVIAYNKLTKAIIPALNEQWTPDWTNTNQRKWYCWFKYESSGFRFGGAVCDGVGSGVGSRLCFHSEDLAIYAAKQFQPEYNQLFN